jgi:hypothetical protein
MKTMGKNEEMSFVKPQKTSFDKQSEKPEKESVANEGPKRVAGVSVDIEMGLNGTDIKKSDPIQATETFAGIPLSIEWPKGKYRMYGQHNEKRGKLMTASYGYFDQTLSSDGEECDFYLGDNKESRSVYLLLQKPTPYDIEHGMIDPECKWMIGFDSMEQAKTNYELSMVPEWFLSISEVSWNDFLEQINTCKTKIDKAVSNDNPLAQTLGSTPPGVGGDWDDEIRAEFKKSMDDLRKYVEDISGNETKNGVDNGDFSDAEKCISYAPNEKRLKLAKNLKEISEEKPVPPAPKRSPSGFAKSFSSIGSIVINEPRLVFRLKG